MHYTPVSIYGTAGVAATSQTIDAPEGYTLDTIDVINIDGADEIYFTVAESGDTPTTPTNGGANTRVVPAASGSAYRLDFNGSVRGLTIRVIAAANTSYGIIAEVK